MGRDLVQRFAAIEHRRARELSFVSSRQGHLPPRRLILRSGNRKKGEGGEDHSQHGATWPLRHQQCKLRIKRFSILAQASASDSAQFSRDGEERVKTMEQGPFATFFEAFVTLFIVIDPILVAPLFAALTHGNTQKERTGIAIQAAMISMGVLFFFALLGPWMLHHLGIELASFRAAGGLLLFLIGFRMFFNPDEEVDAKRPGPKASARDNVAFFPLALPMLAGPGAIATVMLLINDAKVEMAGQAYLAQGAVLAALALVLLIGIPVMMSSGSIAKALGRTGMNMISRLLGMLLMALATQYVFDGIRVGILERVGNG